MGAGSSVIVPLIRKTFIDHSFRNIDGISIGQETPNVTLLNLTGNKIRYLPKNLTTLKQLSLNNNSLSSIPNDVAKAIITYTNLKLLDLAYNSLTALPKEILNHPEISMLILSQNNIENIDFSESKKLRIIYLGNNKLTKIPKIPNNVTQIFLGCNQINEFFIQHQELISLSLSHNALQSIDANSRLEKLVTLDISRNKIKKLPDFSLVTPNLFNLDASYNLITEFPKLSNSIKRIYIQYNKIREIPDFVFEYHSLFYLNIQHNCLEKISSLPLSIQTLLLTHNNIKEIPNEIDTPELSSLSFTDNKLTYIPKFVCSQLLDLSFFKNRIKFIDITTFCENISTLDLSNNNIETIPPQLFTFPYLYTLNLSKNQIKSIPEKIMVSSLTTFNISNNPIESLPNAFPAPIENLYLSNCKLIEFNEYWSDASELINLDVSGNELSEFPMIMPLLKLNISDNKFTKFPYLSPNIQEVDISLNLIDKLHEDFDYPDLEFLDISNNKIKEMENDFKLPKLQKLNISNNPIIGELPNFPSLKCLVTINTNLEIKNNDYELDNLITNDINLPNISKLINPDVFIAYSYHQGSDIDSQDEIALEADINENETVLMFVNANNRPKASKHVLDHIMKSIKYHEYTTEEIISFAITDIMPKLRSKTALIPSYLALVAIRENNAFIARYGDTQIAIFSEEGEQLFAMRNGPPPSFSPDFNYGYSKYLDPNEAQFSSMLSNDYRIDYVPEADVTKTNIDFKLGCKWLVMATDACLNYTDPNEMKEILFNANDPWSVAIKIRNRTVSTMYEKNVSVIVVDLMKRVTAFG
ncbi:hypothetical protein TRFO_12409 [Tritrichomonas foetus]|uniref:PPM-type phosphatase domain-containing protein n=1 Tax=Tritrichomonas foetus TaxID=1144522 RepID=A0A1J4L1X1_9EUKA|nr:hypothetical protein TRFO_12409 [Tritrichomonas foetus]|eukprot:OHT17443.1 hypothetical protein TRFO_12409 [Tritrichomonas foetus]